MAISKLSDKNLKQFIKAGGRKGALQDFDKFVKKLAKSDKKLDN